MLDVQRLKENSKWRKITAGLIPLRNQVATDVWNHWLTESLVVSSPSVCECGHIGCCDGSPSQHASKHAASTGHPIIASFEPGEDWFFDYEEARNDQRYGVTSATRASKKSACFWTRRQGASQLGIASKLAARYRFCFRGRLLASDESAFEQLQR